MDCMASINLANCSLVMGTRPPAEIELPAAIPPELPAPPAETEIVPVDEPLAEDVLLVTVAVVAVEPDEDILLDH